MTAEIQGFREKRYNRAFNRIRCTRILPEVFRRGLSTFPDMRQVNRPEADEWWIIHNSCVLKPMLSRVIMDQ
jgi:hypothetical protein